MILVDIMSSKIFIYQLISDYQTECQLVGIDTLDLRVERISLLRLPTVVSFYPLLIVDAVDVLKLVILLANDYLSLTIELIS